MSCNNSNLIHTTHANPYVSLLKGGAWLNLFGPAHILKYKLSAEKWLCGVLAPPTHNVKVWEHSSSLFCYVQNRTFSFTMWLANVKGY